MPRTLVTGAAVRVGLACSCEFARRGHAVVMAVHQRDERSRKAVDEVTRAGGGRVPEVVACDLSSPSALATLGAHVADGALDAFVHCAALYEAQPLGAVEAERALAHYRVNALAPLLLVQSLRDRLSESQLKGGGAVVLFSDMHTQGRFYGRHASYFASKGAVDALVGALAVELAPTIRCNGVAPGAVAWPEGGDEAMKTRYVERTPLGRVGTPEEAASCAAWLALDASFVTGEIIRVDGGRWLR